MSITSSDIVKALKKKYNDCQQYVYATEVGLSTGYSSRRLDFIVANCYESNGFRIEGIEIKVDKSDLRSELFDVNKHADFYDQLDYFSLACPKDILDIDLVPKSWGIYTVDDELNIKTRRRPIALHEKYNDKLDKAFAVCFSRRARGDSPTSEEIYKIKQEVIEQTRKQVDEEWKSKNASLVGVVERLKYFEELFEECHYWYDSDIEEATKFLKQARYANINLLSYDLDSLVKHIKRISPLLNSLKRDKNDIR